MCAGRSAHASMMRARSGAISESVGNPRATAVGAESERLAGLGDALPSLPFPKPRVAGSNPAGRTYESPISARCYVSD
jgi:hypothetical protein